MITVEITITEAALGGVYSVVRKLREGGIPVRVGPDDEVRLCPVWNADATQLIGRGTLHHIPACMGNRWTDKYIYEPPICADSNVIDVEARVIEDHLQLGNKS